MMNYVIYQRMYAQIVVPVPIYIYMRVCVCVCAYTYTHTHPIVDIYVYMNIYIYISIFLCIHNYTHIIYRETLSHMCSFSWATVRSSTGHAGELDRPSPHDCQR